MLTNLAANILRMGAIIKYMGKSYEVAEQFAFLGTIFSIVQYALIPLFIAVAAAGSVYAVVLGVNLARAEDAEKRQAAKQRLIWAIVGLVSIIVLILLINWIVGMVPEWFGMGA